LSGLVGCTTQSSSRGSRGWLTCGVTDTESADDCGRGVSEGLVAAWSLFGPEGTSGSVVGVEAVSVLVLES